MPQAQPHLQEVAQELLVLAVEQLLVQQVRVLVQEHFLQLVEAVVLPQQVQELEVQVLEVQELLVQELQVLLLLAQVGLQQSLP